MDVRHDIVSPLLFLLSSDVKLISVQVLHKIPDAKREQIRSPAFRRKGEGGGDERGCFSSVQ